VQVSWKIFFNVAVYHTPKKISGVLWLSSLGFNLSDLIYRLFVVLV